MKLFYFAGGILAVAALFWFAFITAGPEPAVYSGKTSSSAVSREDVPGATKPRDLNPPGPIPGQINEMEASKPRTQASMPALPVNAPKETVIESIQEAAVSYEARELPRIRPFLTHPDLEVRQAALQGMITLGDAAAAPLLRAAAKEMTDPEEASAMLKAASYLELPPISLAPAMKKKKAANAAAKP